MSIPPAQHCLTVSNLITVDIPPSPVTVPLSFTKLAHIDVPPKELCIQEVIEEPVSFQKPILDMRDYPLTVTLILAESGKGK